MAEEKPHPLRRWISVGDLLSMAVSLLAVGIAWGSMRNQQQNMTERLNELTMEIRLIRNIQITPGAAENIAAIKQKDEAMDKEIRELKEDQRVLRVEILDQLKDLNKKVDDHMNGTRTR